jgi:hypothetical protein
MRHFEFFRNRPDFKRIESIRSRILTLVCVHSSFQLMTKHHFLQDRFPVTAVRSFASSHLSMLLLSICDWFFPERKKNDSNTFIPHGPKRLGLSCIWDNFQQQRLFSSLKLIEIINRADAEVIHAPQRGEA